MIQTRAKAREKIQELLILKDPASHDTIGLHLGLIAKRYGAQDANKIIEKFGLEQLGHKPIQKKRVRL